jgi:flagellar hook-associated protein 3 FlgL
MRVSTAFLHQRSIDLMQQQQQALLRTQTQLVSQQKLQSAQDDPAAWTAAMGQDQALADNARYTGNAQQIQHRLRLQETALSDSGEVMARVRELVVQGATSTQSDESRRVIARELHGLRETLMGIANRDDGQGRFLFAGTRDGERPFSWDGSAASYAGDAQVRSLAIGPSRTLAEGDAGDLIFLRQATGDGRVAVRADPGNQGSVHVSDSRSAPGTTLANAPLQLRFSAGQYEVRDASNTVIGGGAYTPGATIDVGPVRLQLQGTPADGDQIFVEASQPQDVFALIDKLARLLEQPQGNGTERAQLQTALTQGLREVGTAEDHLLQRRTANGLRLKAADDAQWTLGAVDLSAQLRLSELRDVDVAEAASRLQREMSALQAAQLAFTRVQSLSLFNFLR